MVEFLMLLSVSKTELLCCDVSISLRNECRNNVGEIVVFAFFCNRSIVKRPVKNTMACQIIINVSSFCKQHLKPKAAHHFKEQNLLFLSICRFLLWSLSFISIVESISSV